MVKLIDLSFLILIFIKGYPVHSAFVDGSLSCSRGFSMVDTFFFFFFNAFFYLILLF